LFKAVIPEFAQFHVERTRYELTISEADSHPRAAAVSGTAESTWCTTPWPTATSFASRKIGIIAGAIAGS